MIVGVPEEFDIKSKEWIEIVNTGSYVPLWIKQCSGFQLELWMPL